MKSQLTFITLLVAICSFGAWMLAADARAGRAGHDTGVAAPASFDVARVGRQCLSTGDVAPLLRLVRVDDRTSVQELFDRVQRLRQRNDAEVRDFAEMSFLQLVGQVQAAPTRVDPPTSVAMDIAAPYSR